ncbi:MAG: hypothetical protein IJZ37_00715 [Clostridia bacterium]|nr:hypothetical protein [Clostridia bacterium]
MNEVRTMEGVVPSVCPSFGQAMKRASEQVELPVLLQNGMRLARSLCAVMAETYMLKGEVPIRIGGEELPASVVQGVFACLTAEHLEQVERRFLEVDYEIKNKKGYLRTALYNAAIEFDAQILNDIKASGLV